MSPNKPQDQNILRNSIVDMLATKDLNMKKRRVINASPAVNDSDYVILSQLKVLDETVTKVFKELTLNLVNRINKLEKVVQYLALSRSMLSEHVTVGDPSGTLSGSYIMMSTAYVTTVAANYSRLVIILNGQIGNSAINGITNINMSFGLGAPPIYGMPLTGTLVGQPVVYISPTANNYTPFAKAIILDSLVEGDQVWVDIAASALTGFSILHNLEYTVFSLLDDVDLSAI